ncbi:hypothetical protein ACOSQ4_016372 [Xanthoceras sorbifolium]
MNLLLTHPPIEQGFLPGRDALEKSRNRAAITLSEDVSKQILKVTHRNGLHAILVLNPNPIRIFKTLNFITSLTDYGGKVEELGILIPLLEPAVSRLLKPKNFFLFNNGIIVMYKFFL